MGEELATSRERALDPIGADPFGAFLDQLDATAKTRETYRRALRSWAAYLDRAGEGLFTATRRTVVAYRTDLEDAGRAPATINAYLTALRRFYAWAEAARIYPNIAADVKGRRINRNSPKDALTVDQARRILNRPAASLEELRNAAMIELMMRRGLRTIEVVRADIADLRRIGGESVLYVQGKGFANKGDFVVLGDACARSLARYLEARAAEEGAKPDQAAPLFAGIGNRNRGGRMTTRTVGRIVSAALEAEGMAGATLTAHSLRHTAVTFALQGGATVQEAQALARHASIETTMIYAHNLDRMQARAEHSIDAYIAG